MALKARLSVTQSQSLALTPALRASIQLLQLSVQDLEAFIAGKAEENPLLERLDGPIAGGRPAGAAEGLESRIAERPSLTQHLLQQARQSLRRPEELEIALALLGELDESGYLRADTASVAAALGCGLAAVEAVLDRLQGLEPAGVFARSLAECLALQLRGEGRLDAAFRAILARLPLLAGGGPAAVAEALDLPEAEVRGRVAQLRRLDPKPGLAFAVEEAPLLVPDLLVSQASGGRLSIAVNLATIPRIRLDRETHAGLGARLRRAEERSYLAQQAQEVAWLQRALARRVSTLQAVGRAILERQGDFFFRGPSALRPLTQRSLADALDLSEATVSRVVANKFLASPRGTVPLKRFFSAALGSAGEISAAAAQARLSELVAGESPAHPLSDATLAQRLTAGGLPVARRTVAKYRDLLRIPPAAARRRPAEPAG